MQKFCFKILISGILIVIFITLSACKADNSDSSYRMSSEMLNKLQSAVAPPEENSSSDTTSAKYEKSDTMTPDEQRQWQKEIDSLLNELTDGGEDS